MLFRSMLANAIMELSKDDDNPIGAREALQIARIQKSLTPERVERIVIESGGGGGVTPIERAGAMAGRNQS